MTGETLRDLYEIRFDRKALPRKKAIWRILCRHFFQSYIRPGDTVIDVACGYGEFINHIAAARRIGVDLNPDTGRYLDADIEFRHLSATELSAIGGDVADIVFTSNFLEHLPDKHQLDIFLEQVKNVLKPGGKYLILGPNLRYLPGRYWDFYDHHLGLTHLSLCEALRLHGFEIDTCIDRFLPYTTQTALPTHPLLVWLYLKFRPAWPFMGKQFFIAASRAGHPDQGR